MKVLRILVLTVCLTVLANAQKGILTGTVYDPSGAVIVGSKITAVNQKGEIFEARTNDEGVYSLSLPLDGYQPVLNQKITKYTITVESTGFERFTLKDLKFVNSSKGSLCLDFALDVGAMIDTYPVPSKKKMKKH
jgi:hypothetical protein